MTTGSTRELPQITVKTDTRDVLARARAYAKKHKLQDYMVVDIDAHITESAFWSEIVGYMESDVYQQMARSFQDRAGSPPGLMNGQPGLLYQDVFGRIPHQQSQQEVIEPKDGSHRQTTLARRAMDSMGIDYMTVFPTPMLVLGMHPQPEVEAQIGWAFNRWLCEKVLAGEPRLVGLLYLPFNEPEMCERIVKEMADKPGVHGFTVTSVRNRPVHHNSYMRLYSMIQETGKPLVFHAGFNWSDGVVQTCNRFLTMHALTFPWYNMVHLSNWVINGIPERFPKLRVGWIESGLAWVSFCIQRLDLEYMMRTSEAPLLKRKPSEYIKEMFFSSQPLEVHHPDLLKASFEAIDGKTQFMYASDWPHWDFDSPRSILDLAWMDDETRRNVLGYNAARFLGLDLAKQQKLAAE